MSLRLITFVFRSRFSCRTAFPQMKRKMPTPMMRGPRTFSLSEWRYLQGGHLEFIYSEVTVATGDHTSDLRA